MPTIVAIANQKGGCGKTTTTMHLAGGLSSIGYKVKVVDTDPQATAYMWDSKDSLTFEVQAVPEGALKKELTKIATENHTDIVLVDCPPGLSRRHADCADGLQRGPRSDQGREGRLRSHAAVPGCDETGARC